MAASIGNDLPQHENRSQPTRMSRTAWHRRAYRPERQERLSDEAGFWAQLEECEYGLLALEADHLFDTSYAWAA